MEAACNPSAFQWLRWPKRVATRHQTRHFGFRDRDFFCSPRGECHIGDAMITGELFIVIVL
jgi:hypothetical protein